MARTTKRQEAASREALLAIWHTIAYVGSKHGVPLVPARRVYHGAKTLTFAAKLQDTRKLKTALSPAFADALALSLNADATRITRQRGVILIEITLPRSMWRTIYPDDLKSVGRGMRINIGLTSTNQEVLLQLGGIFAHALVAGTTGSGKTSLMRYLVWRLAWKRENSDLRMLIIDGKGGQDWAAFSRLRHLAAPIAKSPNDGVALMGWALREMERRKETGAPPERLQPMLIVIDELAELLDATGGNKGEVAQAVRRISQIGRSLRMTLVIGTQRPTSDVLGGSIAKANLPLRFTGRVTDANNAYLASGQRHSGAERLSGAGEFIITGATDAARLQAPFLRDGDIAALPRAEAPPPPVGAPDIVTVVSQGAPPPEMVGWAIADGLTRPRGISAKAIREHFSIGMDRARGIRDYARAVYEAIKQQGVTCNVS